MRKKLTPAEKLRRKAVRLADAENARQARQYGPLFAHMAPQIDPAAALRRQQMRRAECIESLAFGPAGPGTRGLTIVQVNWIEHHARLWLGDAAELLRQHALRTYPDYHGYAYSFWCKRLTTVEPLVLEWDRQPAPELLGGWRAVPARTWPNAGYVPPLTRDEFHERFPYRDCAPTAEPHCEGLAPALAWIGDAELRIGGRDGGEA